MALFRMSRLAVPKHSSVVPIVQLLVVVFLSSCIIFEVTATGRFDGHRKHIQSSRKASLSSFSSSLAFLVHQPRTALSLQEQLRHLDSEGVKLYSNNDSAMWMKKHHSPSAERNKEPIWKILQDCVLPKLLPPSSSISDPSTNSALNDEKKPLLRILEVAAGSGVHTVYFSSRLFEYLQHQKQQSIEETKSSNEDDQDGMFLWQSTDPEQSSRESQEAYMEDELVPFSNSGDDGTTVQQEQAMRLLRQCVSPTPFSLTLSSEGIQEEDTRTKVLAGSWNLIVNINMVHISPWSATQGLMVLAREALVPGGILYLYGPYHVKETPTAPSNL